jgi:methyl acetate hydrolase
MIQTRRRAMFQRAGGLGAFAAFNPALAEPPPLISSNGFKAIDTALQDGVLRKDVAGVVALGATPEGFCHSTTKGSWPFTARSSVAFTPASPNPEILI